MDNVFDIFCKLTDDKYRPEVHFAFPYGRDGLRGDPNGAFFAAL